MRKIALFGGSFDPIHKGHIEIAKEAVKALCLDEVIFIPSGISPHKAGLTASNEDRYNMVCLALENEEKLSVSDFEIKKETKCYSFETVKEFKKLYPSCELYFIIGDDQYEKFTTWYKWEELLKMCRFVVFTRGGAEIKPPFTEIKIPPIGISSTEIREKIKNGEDVGAKVNEKVLSYIKEKGLYKESLSEIIKKLKGTLKESRFRHTLGVADTAVALAKHYGADTDKAYLAGLLHDSAKNFTDDELFALCDKYNIPLSEDDRKAPPIIHSYVGAAIAEVEYGIEDKEILDAIYYHTTGSEDMSLLSKIIFVSDMTEPGRKDFPGLSEIRRLMYEDIDKALVASMDATISYAKMKGSFLHPDTLKARNFILAKGKK
ncbi:MAG: nicotinate-nucleotide adenylyltransferase [Clostridia bacterium]|nr:nicotinate-nucleotide adenylyltransferase [Clostridia bacterium]